MRKQADRTSPKNGAKHTTSTTCRSNHNNYIYKIYSTTTQYRKVKANNGHNQQETTTATQGYS